MGKQCRSGFFLASQVSMELGSCLWSICVWFLWDSLVPALRWSFRTLSTDSVLSSSRRGSGGGARELRRVLDLLRDWQDLLESGSVPPERSWQELRSLPSPWGPLVSDSLLELRAAGATLLPTIRRWRKRLEDLANDRSRARARSGQARAQAIGCLILVPVVSCFFYCVFPGLMEHFTLWCGASFFAAGLTCLASFWILALAEKSAWGGLLTRERPWVLGCFCAGERLLSFLRSGTPPDLAWQKAVQPLLAEFPELALEGEGGWSPSVWKDARATLKGAAERGMAAALSARRGSVLSHSLLSAGHAIRRALQLSLFEGRPCQERVEMTLAALDSEIRCAVERELELMGTRTLRPLFVLVAPAILGLLGLAFFLGWESGWESAVLG